MHILKQRLYAPEEFTGDKEMMPIGLLMIEHRLMDRMVALVGEESRRIGKGVADTGFIEAAVDFFTTYVDLCHHGKEENILFKGLAGKEISHEHKSIMLELIAEHERAGKLVSDLDRARHEHTRGNAAALAEMKTIMTGMIELYRFHIEKEDNRFFVPSMNYFSKVEKGAMLFEMREFDRQLIHKVYRDVVERFEGSKHK